MLRFAPSRRAGYAASIGGAVAPSTPAWANTYSLDFDGANDNLDMGASFQSTFRDSFSISLWVKLTDGIPGTAYTPNLFGVSLATNHRIFAIIGNEAGSDDGKLSFYYRVGGTQVHTRTDAAAFTNGAQDWAHLVYTVEEASDGVKIYKDGSELATSEVTGSMSSTDMSTITLTDNLLFGARNQNGSGNYWLDCGMDEVSIWDAKLSSAQVTTIYNSGVPTDLAGTTNLVGYWRMEENTGTTVADSSTNSNTATLATGPTFSTDVPS